MKTLAPFGKIFLTGFEISGNSAKKSNKIPASHIYSNILRIQFSINIIEGILRLATEENSDTFEDFFFDLKCLQTALPQYIKPCLQTRCSELKPLNVNSSYF